MTRMTRPTASRRWLVPGLLVALAALLIGAGASAAFESDTVGSYWRGLWWSVSLMTTVGFIGAPPRSPQGVIASVVLMLSGFLLLSLISAALASRFVREDEEPIERQELESEGEILRMLGSIQERLDSLESRLAEPGPPAEGGSTNPGDPPRA